MLKENSHSRAHMIETPEGLLSLERDKSRARPGTRLRFPQVSASLQTRWCSSALKIDVGRRALNNQQRFNHQRILFVTGERREESSNRARYNQLEPHACDRRSGRKGRHVDSWRPVLHWSEQAVWAILERHGVLPPVPYRLGWGRSSCRLCIFSSRMIWATLRRYFPESLDPVANYEQRFESTISRDRIPVLDVADQAKSMEIEDFVALEQSRQHEYTLPIFAGSGHEWTLPPGAYARASAGPV